MQGSDFRLGGFMLALAIASAIAGIVLWRFGAFLVRHVRIEWVA